MLEEEEEDERGMGTIRAATPQVGRIALFWGVTWLIGGSGGDNIKLFSFLMQEISFNLILVLNLSFLTYDSLRFLKKLNIRLADFTTQFKPFFFPITVLKLSLSFHKLKILKRTLKQPKNT